MYQVIWSSVKDCYVVVSENAGRHGKKKAVHLAPSTAKRTMLAMSLGAAVLMGSGAAAEAAATGENATINGGVNGDASGKYSSISGGKDNVDSGENSSISGGSNNTATGKNASISGGGDNEAIGEAASVSGGSQGKATGTRASVTGGLQNQAAGEFATVNGGSGNKAFGWGSSIIGGTGNVVGKMAVDENGNPKFKDSKGNDVVATIKKDKKGNTYLVDSKGNVIKDANPYTDPNSFAGSVAVAIGGMSSSVQGNYSVGIAGGSTSASASSGLAAGRQATVTMANGVAIGYESTASVINSSRAADKEGRIVSFGHQKGDVYYDVDYQNHTVTEHKYDSAAYNRLVNVADGIDDHDVVVMEQLKNAKAEAVAEAKTNIKVKGDEFNVHAAESTDAKGVQTTTISLLPKVTLQDSKDTTGSKAVVLDGTAGTISAGLSTDTANRISFNGTTGLANIGAITIGKQNDYSYTYYAPVYDSQDNMTISSTRTTESGKFITGLDNTTWTPGKYASGRAATEDQLEQAGRHFLSIKIGTNTDGTTIAENTLANYYNDGATGTYSLAFGVNTKSSGDYATSMGINSTASGLRALAVGYDNTASGTESVSVGTENKAAGNFSVALGVFANAGTANTDTSSTTNGAAVAVGFQASATKTGSSAYGYNARAVKDEGTALGVSSVANVEGGVAVGAHSIADVAKGAKGYLAGDSDTSTTWVSTAGAMSLGGNTKDEKGNAITVSRQITNLAAGTNDTDAVNVAQLKALASQGMNFQGNDTSTSVHLNQGGTLQIQGSGRKDDEEYSTQNVKVLTDTANNRLSIALDKNPDFDSVTAGTEGTSADGGKAGSIKIVGADSSNAQKATTITAGYAASPELAGTNGTGRISYTDGDGTAHTVATLGDGLKLAGDTGTGSVALDNTLTVSGGATNLADGSNIGVTANGSNLSLQLAKNITGLDTVTAGGVKMGTQTDGNDTTKSGKYVTGLDNTAWTVGQTQPVHGRAATEDQLKSVSDVVNTNQTNIATNTEAIGKGLNFQANTKETNGSYKTVNRALGSTVAVRANDAQDGHTYKTDNLTTEIDDNGIITVKMDTQLTADRVTVGKDGNAITLDGSNGNVTTGSSTLGGTGLTIANGPSVTTGGISGGNQKITEVASGASGTDASSNPIYDTDTNGANIGDVKKIAAKTVTVSGDNKNTKVAKTTNADGTVDYTVSLNDSVTLGSYAGKRIALDGMAGTISAGDKVTLNGANGTATIGGATLGNDGTNTYLTGLTNKTWDPNNITSGRAATEDQLQTVSNTVNAGWEVDVNNSKLKDVTPNSKTVNFVEGQNISITGLNDSITVATKPKVQFTSVYVGGTFDPDKKEYTGGIKIANQAGGGANTSDGNYITGLSNTKWEKDNIVSGRAATEDQLNQVAKTMTGEIQAGDVYVNGGGITYDAAGNGTLTLDRNNNKPITFEGVKNNYVTGAAVSSVRNAVTGKNDPHLTLTRNDRGSVDVDLSGIKKYDFRLVQNTASDSDGKYKVQADGTVGLIVANGDGESETITLQDLASKTTVDQGLKLEGNTKAADGTSYKSVKRSLGDTIAVRAADAQAGHTYTTNNLTTDVDDNGVITVKMDNQVNLGQANTSEGANDGNDGNLHVTGKSGNYVEINGSDGSFRMGLGNQYASLNQDYGGDKYLKEQGDSSPRFTYTVNGDENTKQTLATLSDGMNYSGDMGKAAVLLNKNVQIIGGVTDADKLTADDAHNIGVVASQDGDNGKLTLKLAKDLTDLTSVTAGTAKLGNQTIADSAFGNNNNPKTGNYLTGLDNKNWKADSIFSGRAATEDQLQQVAKSIVNGSATGGGFGLSADKEDSANATEVKQDLGSSIKITTGGDTNLSTQADSANKAIVVSLNKELNLTKTTLTDGTTGATTVVDGNGVVITPKQGTDADKVKLTTDGLSNGGKQITNVQSGLNGTTIENAAGDVLNHGATIGDLQTVSNGVKTDLTATGLNFKGNGDATVHRNLGDTLTIQGTGANGRDYDGGANVQVLANKDTGTLTVQLDRDLNAHTLTLGKASNGTETGEAGTLILNGKNKDNGMSPVSIGVTYRGNQDKEAMKTAMSRITYKGGNGNDHTVATLEDGLQLSGDNGETLNTTLDKKVTIKGGVAKDKLVDNTTDPTKNNNIGVVASQDNNGNTTLSLQLAKDIAGLNTVMAGQTLKDGTGPAVLGYQTVVNSNQTKETGNYVTGLSNKDWNGTYVSGRAATEDQLKKVSDSIRDTVGASTFALTAGGQGEATDATITKKVGESIRIFGDAPKVSGSGDGDGWDRSKANILTKVKKDNKGDEYISVELQDHLEVGTHAGKDTDGKDVAGVDGSMQFKGASAKEVNITGDTGIALSDNGNQTAALRQDNGTGYLDLAGSEGAFTSLFTQNGAQNLSQDNTSKTRLTYKDQNDKSHDVATMDDGLVVAGDNGQVTRLLNSTLKLSGGEKDETKLSRGQNIGVVANKDNDGQLDIKLAKDLTDIDSITMTGGLKLNSTNGSSTITGLTNTSVDLSDFGKAGRAATEEQLQQVKDGIANATKGGGFGLADDKGTAVKADLGSNIGIHGDGNITTAVSDDGKSLNIGLKKDVDLGNDGSIKAGGVTINNKGIDAGSKQITNVASGATGKDDKGNAVYGNDSNAANIGDVHTIVDNKVTAINNNVSDIKNDVDVIKKTGRTYQGDDKKTVKVDFAEGKFLSLTGGANDVSTENNIGVMANGENGLSIRLAKKLNGLESVTTGKTTMDDNGLTIAGSDGKAGTTVTGSGINIASDGEGTHAVEVTNSNVSMGGQQIHDVADGQSDGDAVNVSQLKKSVGALGGAIDKVDRRVDRVGAGAAALAALHPQDFDPDDKWDFAVGYGNYRGANAAAVGAFYRPNEDTTFSVGGTVGGGENMVNAGVSFKFGQGNHVSNSRVAMAKEIKDLRKEVESLRSALVDVAAGKQLDPAKTKLFPDMPKNHWAYKEISELAGNGLLDGYPDGEFKGDRMMTRYEFASIVYRQMMAGRELSDRLVQEFEPELERIRIDVIARHKDGTPSIERVRVNKPADKNSK
ncbi:YadA-like family protein [Mitsuokella jalaludinii]|uniref:YadA-like family protein n=2 Tax=Mitsuokella jalaludinii TaxID=187979 RepID=UPI00242E2BAD|nr:YadA-like family protein [Mitsuokella jalaludinii]